MKEFYSFSARLTKYFLKNGFEVVEVKTNAKNPYRDVWIFEDTPELRAALTKFSK